MSMTVQIGKKLLLAFMMLAVTAANAARTLTLAKVNRSGRTVESFDFAFGGDAAGQTYALYMAYGVGDGGYSVDAWEHCVKLADIGPGETSRTAVAVPDDVTGDAQWAKFFLCEDCPELDYIRSVGDGQLIDTGVTPDATTTVAIDCQVLALPVDPSSSPLLGARYGEQGRFVYWFTQREDGIYPAINWGTADSGYIVRPETRVDDGFHVFSNDGGNFLMDGTRIYNAPQDASLTPRPDYSIILFGARNLTYPGGPVELLNNKIEARVRSVRIKNGDTVIRDYVAAERADGRAGLFDRACGRLSFADADFSSTDRGVPTGNILHVPVANVPAVPVKFGSRTVSVARVNRIGDMEASVDLAFGGNARGVTYALYMAYGETDAGASPTGWNHLERMLEVAPETTALTAVPVPSATHVRFFLCNEFTQLESIASGSGQIIDTGVTPDQTTSVTFDWQVLSGLGHAQYAPVFGLRNDDEHAWRWVMWIQNMWVDQENRFVAYPGFNWGSADSGFVDSDAARQNLSRNVLSVHDVNGAGVAFDVNGTPVWSDPSASLSSVPAGWTLTLFGLRSDAQDGIDAHYACCGVRVYGLKISNGSTPIRDYVPAMRAGRAGLYDRVSESFVTARAGVDFTGAARGRACGTILEAAAASDALLLATAAGATGAARPMSVEPKTLAADGSLASVSISFPEGEGVGTLALYAVYGETAGGETVESWAHSEKVGDIAGTTTQVDYVMPAGWGSTSRFLRFIYKPEESTLPAFFDDTVTPVEYLASDGSGQAIRIAAYPSDGDTFTFKWRQTAIDILRRDEDKGFDFGNWPTRICSGGRHSFDEAFLEEVCAYVFNAHMGFSPNLYLAEINTKDVFVDTVKFTRPFVYEKKRLVDGKTWSIENATATPEGYVSNTDLYLFCGHADGNGCDSHSGRKAVYAVRVAGADRHVKLNLIPVVKNGVAGLYDSVTGAFHVNCGSGTFTAGPSVDLRSGASAIVCAAKWDVPVFGDVASSGESAGDAFSVSGTLARTGNGPATVTVQTSTTADFAEVTDWPTVEVTADGGAFAATVTPVMPGMTVYWRAKAVNAASGATVYTQVMTLDIPGPMVVGSLQNLSSTGLIVSPGAFTLAEGYGTTHIWLEWGKTPECRDGVSAVRTYPCGTPIDFAETVQMSAYGDYYYRVVASNECSTAASVSRSESKRWSVVDNVTYTWCGGANGSWRVAENWTKSTAGAGYPNSAACTVEIPAATSPVITLDGAVETLHLNLAEGADCEFRGESGSDPALTIREDVFWLNPNTKCTFRDCAVSAVNFSARQEGSELTFTNATVVTIPAENDCLAAGRGGRIVIADSQVTVQNVYFNSDGNGSEYVLQGRTSTLRVRRFMRSASGYKDGTLRIVMPERGFDATPIARLNPVGDSPFGWDNDWNTYSFPADLCKFTLVIDPASPGLKAQMNFRQTLIDWSAGGCGIKKDNLPLAPLVCPSFNRLAYGDDTSCPMTLLFKHKSGFFISFR